MNYKEHKRLGWKLSRICFGGAAVSGKGAGYGFGDITENNAIDLVKFAFDQGINFFDSAPIYGFGESERILGLALKGIRDDVFLASKAGVDWHDNKRVNMSNDPKVIKKMFEQSLKRFDSDFIDLYMIHWPDKNIDIRYSLEVLENLKAENKIKSIGLCNTNSNEVELAREVCHIDFIQSEFNLFNDGFRDLNKDEFYSMGWGSFDKGILAGSVKKDSVFDSSDCRSWAPWWKKSDWKNRVDKAQKVSKELQDHSLRELSLLYSQAYMDSSICGMRTQKHIEDLCHISKLELSSSDLQRSLELLDG